MGKFFVNLHERIKRLLSSTEASCPYQGLKSCRLWRSPEERRTYNLWKQSAAHAILRDWLRQEFGTHTQQSHQADHALSFLSCAATKGFVWRYDNTRWSANEFRYFFHFLAERAMSLGYARHNAETAEDDEKQQTTHRYLLKPDGGCHESGLEYGNILIILTEENSQPTQIKFSATRCCSIHQDAKDFDQLVNAVLANAS